MQSKLKLKLDIKIKPDECFFSTSFRDITIDKFRRMEINAINTVIVYMTNIAHLPLV